MATYKLFKAGPDQAFIIRGSKRVGTLTQINGMWHERLRIKNSDAITAKDTDLVKVFDLIMDQRLESTR